MRIYGISYYDEYNESRIECISLSLEKLKEDYNPEFDMICYRELNDDDVISLDGSLWTPYDGRFYSNDYYYNMNGKIVNENEIDENELTDDDALGYMVTTYKDGEIVNSEFEPV